MGYYLIEIVRVEDDQRREVVAAYGLADLIDRHPGIARDGAWKIVDVGVSVVSCRVCRGHVSRDDIDHHEGWHRGYSGA